jgi:integrase/recombinase XerC/integrase/recombinase XerD
MNIKIDDAIQQFLVDQELKGNTKKTIMFYDNNLRYFREFIKDKLLVSDIDMADLNGYLLMLKKKPKLENHPFKPKVDKPISTTTVQTYVRAVRGFVGWLYKEGYIPDNLQDKYKLPKAIKKTVEILSDEEIETVMKAFNVKSELGLRNACLVALMLDCGLRRNEALYLDYDNVHISQGIIKVIGKGQKERIVPLGLYTKKLLLKYINGFRPMPEYDTKRLFISKDLKPMTENSIKQLFLRLRKKCKIDRLHPHMLRHTFATKYLMNGGDVFSLQQILGHTSLEMVRKYSHIASAYMINNHKRFSPLDNLYRNKQNA